MRPLMIFLLSLATGMKAQNTPEIPQGAPYELKGFTLGASTLAEFKSKFYHCADLCSDKEQKKYKGVPSKFAPFCSDEHPETVRPPATNADWTKSGLVFCEPYYPFEQVRGQSFTIADIQTTARFDFFQNRLFRISAVFPNFGDDNFRSMLQALTGKYGPPISQEQHEYQNGFGAKFSALIVIWENSASRIVLSEMGANKDTSGVEFTHTQLLKEADAAAPKKSSKDL